MVILKFFVSKKNVFVWKGDTKKSYEKIKDHGATRAEFWKSFHFTSMKKDGKAWKEYHRDDDGFCELFNKYADEVQGKLLPQEA